MRAKWSAPIRKYWKVSEQMMVKYCDLAICDSVNIEKYIALSLLLKEGLDMTNMNVIPVSQDSYIVNGCKVKITYAEDGDSMEVLQKLIHDTLREEAKNYN